MHEEDSRRLAEWYGVPCAAQPPARPETENAPYREPYWSAGAPEFAIPITQLADFIPSDSPLKKVEQDIQAASQEESGATSEGASQEEAPAIEEAPVVEEAPAIDEAPTEEGAGTGEGSQTGDDGMAMAVESTMEQSQM